MAHETSTDKFLDTFTQGVASPSGIVPLKPPKAFHKLERDLYGLVEFPTKVLLMAFQEVFASLDKWRYSPEMSQTNIYIRDKYPELAAGDSQRTELKPAIVTDRGPIRKKNVDGRQNQKRFSIQYPTIIQFTDLLQVPMTLHCLSKKGPEAERIASAVFAVLVIDEDVFKRRGVHAVLGAEIGTEGLFAQDAEIALVDVPVSCVLEYAWSWARKPDGEPIISIAELGIEDP